MAVLFAWNERQTDKISFENLRLATELPDAELRRTLWVTYYQFKFEIQYLFFPQSLVAFPKLKRQILLCEPEAKSPKDFSDVSLFWVNQEFAVM